MPFLVGAFLKRRVDYRQGSSSLFMKTTRSTRIVLPKVLQNFPKTPNCTCWPQVWLFRSDSSTYIEYFAFTATKNRFHHSSRSILVAICGETQYAGNPATPDVPAAFAISQLSYESRSAMLKLILSQIKENRFGVTVIWILTTWYQFLSDHFLTNFSDWKQTTNCRHHQQLGWPGSRKETCWPRIFILGNSRKKKFNREISADDSSNSVEQKNAVSSSQESEKTKKHCAKFGTH